MKGRSSFGVSLPITVLGIAASPRRGGNSDLLLERALEGAAQAGAKNVFFPSVANIFVQEGIDCWMWPAAQVAISSTWV